MDAFGRKMSNWNVLSVETALQQLNTFEEDSKDFITRSNTVNYQETESLIIITILNKLIILILILFVIIVLVKKIAKCQNHVLKMNFYMILLECTY